MITKKCCLILLVALLFGHVEAQDLNALTKKIQQQIGAVQTASKNYEASVEIIQPGVMKYVYDEIDAKGNRTNYAYEFNLADIDPYAVREQTQKDAIFSILAAKNKQKLIKAYKNNEVQSYTNEVSIIAKDIESARALNENIKKAIPLAEKEMTNRLKVSGYDGMVNWLASNIKTVNLGTKTHVQSITKGDKPGVLVFKENISDGKTSTEETYTFNLADLNVNSVNFKITGNKISVVAETLNKSKFIEYKKNGEVKPYTNGLEINTNNVDEARDVKTIITLAIPLAEEKVKADLPKVNSEKDGLATLKSLTTEITLGPKKITQLLEPGCICKLTQTESDAKATTTNSYTFNWMDLNAKATKIDVSGDKLSIVLETADKKKLVMYSKNEKFSGYENSIQLYMPDIEHARRARAVVDKVIEKCSSAYKNPFGSGQTASLTWLINNTKEVTLEDLTVKQALELVEAGKYDKLKYTRSEVNAKGAGPEEIFEFNLTDVHPPSIRIDTKGKWLYVSFESDGKNKIFKYYKDGKIQPYTNKIEFAINDIELARNVLNALTQSITALKTK